MPVRLTASPAATFPRKHPAPLKPLHTLLLVLCLLLAGAAVPAAEETVTLNLKDADIKALVGMVSEVTGRNFVIDPRVKGKVTVISSRPMGKDEVYQVFLSILQVHGYSAVPAGEVVKIVPDVAARQAGNPAAESGEGDAWVTRVVPLENVSARQLLPLLRPLVPQQGHMAVYGPGNVLIISDRAANVERLRRIIRRIDVAGGKEIEVIRLENASASEIVRILKALHLEGTKNQPGAPRIRLAADERTNSVLISGEESARLRLRTIISHLDTPLEHGGNTQVIYLKYAEAEELAPVLQGIAKDYGKQGKKVKPDKPVDIQADPRTNALVITAPPDLLRNLQSVIRRLDVRRAQVLVEAIIAEMSMDRARELGVQWAADGSGDGAAGLTNFGGRGSSLAEIATGIRAGTPIVGNGLTLALGAFSDTNVDFAAIIRALAADASTNILSTPSLVTLDNQEAEIVVGQNVPFITGQFVTSGPGNALVNPFQTIQRQDIGLTLKVTPQINEGDAVKLDIVQEVSSISPTTTGAADIVTNKRSIRTSVLVESGRIVVLGGLMDDNLQETVQKVPLLGDMPLLGGLFRYKNTTKVKRSLMVFLRSLILRDGRAFDASTARKYNYFRALQLEARERGVALMPEAQPPLLPDLDELMAPPPRPRSPQPPPDNALPPTDDETAG